MKRPSEDIHNSTEEIKKELNSFELEDGVGLIDTSILNPPYRDLCNRTYDPYAGIFGRNIAEVLARKDMGLLSPFPIGVTAMDMAEITSMITHKPNVRTIDDIVREIDDTLHDVNEIIPEVKESKIIALPDATLKELKIYRSVLLGLRDVLASRVIPSGRTTEYFADFLVSLRSLVMNGNGASSEKRKLEAVLEREKKHGRALVADERLFASGLKVMLDGGKCTIFTRDADLLRIMQKTRVYLEKYLPLVAERFDEGDLKICFSGGDHIHYYGPKDFGTLRLKSRKYADHIETYRKRLLTSAYRSFTESAESEFMKTLRRRRKV